MTHRPRARAGLFSLLLLFAPLLTSPAIAGGGTPCDGDWCPHCSMQVPSGVVLVTPAGTGPSLAEQGMTITDADEGLPGHGTARFSGTPAGGGWLESTGSHDSVSHLELLGIWTPTEGAISFVSPDLTGDLRVDLADVALFGIGYTSGPYVFSCDLHHDGRVDLRDLGVLGTHYGEACAPAP